MRSERLLRQYSRCRTWDSDAGLRMASLKSRSRLELSATASRKDVSSGFVFTMTPSIPRPGKQGPQFGCFMAGITSSVRCKRGLEIQVAFTYGLCTERSVSHQQLTLSRKLIGKLKSPYSEGQPTCSKETPTT